MEKSIGLNSYSYMRVNSESNLGKPKESMEIAESLYLRGKISYPRTSESEYSPIFLAKLHAALYNLGIQIDPNDIDCKKLLSDIRNSNKTLTNNHGGLTISIDSAHPPITPLKFDTNDLKEKEIEPFNLICQHFLAMIRDYGREFVITTVTFRIGDYDFVVKEKASRLSEFLRDRDRVPITDLKVEETDYLKESELIGNMETYGIGRPGTVGVITEKLENREYIQLLMPGRRLMPTGLAIGLVNLYKEIAPDLIAPEFRRNLEKKIGELVEKDEQATKKRSNQEIANEQATKKRSNQEIAKEILRGYKPKFEQLYNRMVESMQQRKADPTKKNAMSGIIPSIRKQQPNVENDVERGRDFLAGGDFRA